MVSFPPFLHRLTNLRTTLNKAGTEAKVGIPGFTAEDFDRTGKVLVTTGGKETGERRIPLRFL